MDNNKKFNKTHFYKAFKKEEVEYNKEIALLNNLKKELTPLYNAYSNIRQIEQNGSMMYVKLTDPNNKISKEIQDMRKKIGEFSQDNPEHVELAKTYFKYMGDTKKANDVNVVKEFKKAIDINFVADSVDKDKTKMLNHEMRFSTNWNNFCKFKENAKIQTLFKNSIEKYGIEIYKDMKSNKEDPEFSQYYKNQCVGLLGASNAVVSTHETIDSVKNWMKKEHVVAKFCYDAIDTIYEKFDKITKFAKDITSNKKDVKADDKTKNNTHTQNRSGL